MKKIIVLLLSLLLIIACVGCGTPKEIVKDKKFTAASYANYVTIKTRVEDMRTEFPDEWDEEQQRWEYHLTPIGTVVVEVEPIGSYKTEFTDCTLNVSFDAGNLGKGFVDITIDETGRGVGKIEKTGSGWRSKTKTSFTTPNVSTTVSAATGRVKTYIPYNREEDK